jgi:beta-glucosidase
MENRRQFHPRITKLGAVFVASFCFLATAASPSGAQQPSAETPYVDPQVPVEQRVSDLISRMTLEEKVSQLGHTAASIPRLHIPEYNWWNEGLHGVARAGVATVFPQAIGMAATFDEPLMHQAADAISTEFRAKYYAALRPDGSAEWYRGLTVWSPNINIFRDPRWGRGQETYGEDPFLTSRMGVAFVTGLQGSDPHYFKTVATSKHFAVHSGPESTRHTVNIEASLHDIEDTYLPAFRATITEGKAESVMCAYNSLNGQPACANTFLLEQRLRKDWGFQGYVVSDCGAVGDVFRGHKFAATPEEGIADVFKAGMDLICGDYRNNMSTERAAIVDSVRHGLLPESVVDTALRRLFTARFRLGMFDPAASVPFSNIAPADNDSEAHNQIALRMARESLVLLKNRDGFLPLKRPPATIAVIGPNADSLDALEGNYNGTPSKPITVLTGIRVRFPQAKVIYAQGTGLVGPVTNSIPSSAPCPDILCSEHDEEAHRAVEAARAADLVVMVLGLSARVEGEEMKVDAAGFSGGDRTSIDLPAPQEQLLEQVYAAGKPVVLVLMNGSALGINWANANLLAILEGWYPGGQGGTAIAEALAGDFSPAGRLPVTFYKSVGQLPPFEDYSMARRTYRYFDGEPLYPFGFGLSYTSFSYGKPHVGTAQLSSKNSVSISVEVKNTGTVASDEVVQLYLTHAGVPGAPLRALAGFRRLHFAPGEKKTVSFVLHDRDLSVVDESGAHRIIPGKVQAWIGGGQPVATAGAPKPPGAAVEFNLINEVKLPN